MFPLLPVMDLSNKFLSQFTGPGRSLGHFIRIISNKRRHLSFLFHLHVALSIPSKFLTSGKQRLRGNLLSAKASYIVAKEGKCGQTLGRRCRRRSNDGSVIRKDVRLLAHVHLLTLAVQTPREPKTNDGRTTITPSVWKNTSAIF